MNRQTSWPHLVAVVGFVLLVAVVASESPDVSADSKGYVFTPLVFLGDQSPMGDIFVLAFGSNFINNRGDVLFGAGVTTEEEGGLFLLRKEEIFQIARTGEPAPGGGVYDFGFFLSLNLQRQGRGGVCLPAQPVQSSLSAVNAGVYRFSQSTHTVTPVVIPEVTAVPGGGVFRGRNSVSVSITGETWSSRARC